MFRRFLSFALAVGVVVVATPATIAGEVAATCFTPGENCEGMIVQAISGARRQILVQAFSFTSRSIGDALVAAKKRGIDVRLIMDAEQYAAHPGEARWCARHGIPVALDAPSGQYAHAHDKVGIIDGYRVITGSFNWTTHAEAVNVENLLVLDGTDVADRYIQHFAERAQVARPLAE